MNITELVYLGIPISVVIMGLVQIAKQLGLPTKFGALFALVLGIIAGGIGFYFISDYAILFLGLLSGLTASGLYSGIKNTKEKFIK